MENIQLHLTEHHGDCCPGSKLFIEFSGGLTACHNRLREKDYRYMRPGLEHALTMELIDPFGNKLPFSEALKNKG